ncbi:TonB-dependent receptor plug domain-containing protein [Arcobacter sp.]|uniref:TonB-dependent receptor plug domain-containing protein n=1 Tax=Arcobacter sp. TaxID=1872629 RepID=UPI003D0C4F32
MNKKITTSFVASFLLATSNLYSQQLSEITVVSATKSEQSIKDVTSDIEVITKEELEERHFSNVSDAIKKLAGVSIVSNGGLGQNDSLYIRGIEAKRILILIDGIRYNEPAGLSGAPLAQLNIENVEQIEVVKGAQSGIWGADASGGVINIITTKAKTGLHGNIAVEAGSYRTKKINSSISTKNDIGYVKLDASRLSTDGISSYEPNGYKWDKLGYENDFYTNNTYNIGSGLYLSDKDELNLSFKKIYAKYAYDSSSADNSTNQTKLQHYFKSVNYLHNENSYQLKLNAQQSKFDRTQNTFNAKSLVNEFSLQTNFIYLKSDTFVLGIDKQNFEDINNKIKYNTKAVFISNTNKINSFIINETLRHDRNSKFKKKTTGKIGIKYNIAQDIALSSNFGTAYNAPTLSNLNYTPSLSPETTKSYDINFEYKDLKITYFKNKIKDMIEYVAGSYPNTRYENLSGESIFKGFEVSYSKNIVDNTLLSLNYTNSSSKDNKGNDLARRAKEELNLSLDYYGIEKTHINLNSSYTGRRYDDSAKTKKTGNYTLWNGVINYEIKKNITTYVKVDNIFNKYYQTIYNYATPRRSAYVGLKVSF